MIKKKDEYADKNQRDSKITQNSFTQAVKKAGVGGEETLEAKKREKATQQKQLSLKAEDELIRAKEAKNDTTTESESFRRDEN